VSWQGSVVWGGFSSCSGACPCFTTYSTSFDSRYGNFCVHVIPATRLLALSWRFFSPPSSDRLWPQFAVCLPDVGYCVVDSLPPLQLVHGVQEQASRLGMVELPVDLGVCIEIRELHAKSSVALKTGSPETRHLGPVLLRLTRRGGRR